MWGDSPLTGNELKKISSSGLLKIEKKSKKSREAFFYIFNIEIIKHRGLCKNRVPFIHHPFFLNSDNLHNYSAKRKSGNWYWYKIIIRL